MSDIPPFENDKYAGLSLDDSREEALANISANRPNPQFDGPGGQPNFDRPVRPNNGFGVDPGALTSDMDPEAAQELEDANRIIQDKLELYGLGELADLAYQMLVDDESPQAVMDALQETDAFKQRFAGMEARRQAGLPAISPADYIRLEDNYRSTMAMAGLPPGFYDSPDDFAEFIGNDVSPQEMQQRVSFAATAVSNADPNLKAQLRELYGVGVEDEGELIAYYLDPQRGTSVIEQRLQLEAAGLSSAAISTLGSGFEQGTAERLANLGVQRREVTERLQGQTALTQQLLGEDTAVTSSELAAAEFGLDSEATSDIAKLRQQRQQRGRRQAGVLMARGGVSGLGRAT
jgi:hypothetical protein